MIFLIIALCRNNVNMLFLQRANDKRRIKQKPLKISAF